MPTVPLKDLSSRRSVQFLGLVLLVALGLRLLAVHDYGRDWYYPGSFTLINFDEGGSCRAALDGFSYTPFVGHQTIALARMAGATMEPDKVGDAAAVKTVCHSDAHITVARLYSAAVGSLTVGVLFLLSQLLFPGRHELALGSAALLALSGWHISESMVGTVDAASTFFIYLFLTAAVWAVRSGGIRWLLAAALLVPALWTKYWVFALFSMAVLVPPGIYPQLLRGISRRRLALLIVAYALLFGVVSNTAMPPPGLWVAPVFFYALLPWKSLSNAGRLLFFFLPWLAPLAMHVDVFVALTSGSIEGRFGTDYGAIGWHKVPRNLLNPILVLLVGLGLPALVALVAGIQSLWRRQEFPRAWLVLMPLPVFLLYMAFLAPVTYYRHYLPLLPAACLLAALGLSHLGERQRSAWVVVLLWQALLALDLVSDYHLDPRRQLPDWYAQNSPSVVMSSFYVNPPPYTGAVHRLFRESYARGEGVRLRLADTLILSENWYDTAFANELNGPLVHNPDRLIKTRPQAVAFYRAALSDEHPVLEQRAHFKAPGFMPELLLHRAFYGSFTQFVGDIVVYRIKP